MYTDDGRDVSTPSDTRGVTDSQVLTAFNAHKKSPDKKAEVSVNTLSDAKDSTDKKSHATMLNIVDLDAKESIDTVQKDDAAQQEQQADSPKKSITPPPSLDIEKIKKNSLNRQSRAIKQIRNLQAQRAQVEDALKKIDEEMKELVVDEEFSVYLKEQNEFFTIRFQTRQFNAFGQFLDNEKDNGLSIFRKVFQCLFENFTQELSEGKIAEAYIAYKVFMINLISCCLEMGVLRGKEADRAQDLLERLSRAIIT